MTRKEAIAALTYWSTPGIVPVYILNKLEALASPVDEAPLHTALRLVFGHVPTVAAFDHREISRLVAIAGIDEAR